MRSAPESLVFVGRRAELDALHAAFETSVEEGTRTVVIGGEAGIGKSRLIDEFLGTVRGQAIVLRGQCVDLNDGAPPYAPVTAALRELGRAVGPARLTSFVGAARLGLRVLLPEIEIDETVGSPSPTRGAALVFDAVIVALEEASRERPIVLVIEDLQWADQASLSLLRFLVRVATRGRLLLVLSYRTDELGRGHPLRAWLPELERSDRVERHELARLNARQVRELVTALRGSAPEPGELSSYVDRTEGVPFLIEEFAHLGSVAPRDCVPDSLRDVLLTRYETLGEHAQHVVRIMSAGGTCIEHSLLEAVWGGAPEDIDSAAREAITAGLIAVDGTVYAFRHALVRDAIHDELLPGERVRFHTAIADALEKTTGAVPPAAEISYHRMAAHDSFKAFASSLVAMSEARASFAYATAARMGERAIELWEQVPEAETVAARSRSTLLAETAHDLRNAGESERAIALVEEALRCADGAEEPAAIARMLRDKASYLANVGRLGSVDELREALQVLEGSPASVLRANVLGELAARLMLEARYDESVEVADRGFAEAQTVGSAARMSVAANIRGVSLMSSLQVERGLSDISLAGELAGDDDSARLRYWINYSDALALLGRFGEAIAAAEEGAERARLRGVERTTGAMLMANTVDPLYSLGQWSRADGLLERALELDAPIGFAAHLQRRKLWSTLWRGDVDEAARLLRSWRLPLSRQLQTDVQSRLGLSRVAGEIALENGRVDEAWHEVESVIAGEHRPSPAYDLPLLAVTARILACARSTRTTDAGKRPGFDTGAEPERRLREMIERVAAWPTAFIFSSLVDAELGGENGTGDDERAWHVTREAMASPLAPASLRLYSAARLAESLASAGDRQAALDLARETRVEAAEIGIGLVVRRLDALDRRVGGGASPTRVDTGVLTEREHQVLELVARGLSNRQIATELYISVKTASVHVSNILRKLGAATRTEAAYLAHDLERIG